MRMHVFSLTVLFVLVLLGASAAVAADPVVFSTGGPQAADIGEGPGYYGVQSILSTNWYPTNDGETSAVGDWFVVAAPARITGVTFWGLLKNFGGGPGELHVYIYAYDPGQDAFVERFHACNDNTPDWAAFHVQTEDPSSLGTDSVERWHAELASLPGRSGNAGVGRAGTYLLVVAGDDWADEFSWASNAPGGLVGGQYDSLYWAPTKDVATTGLNWAPLDLGYGAAANNLAFELTGVPMPAGDFDFDEDVDLSDFAHFQACFNGLNRPPRRTGCDDADLDIDGDVDLTDFESFHACFNGPNRAAACP